MHAQPHAISGGWDREPLLPNPVTGGYIDINENPLYTSGCIAALQSLSLTVNNLGGFSAFGQIPLSPADPGPPGKNMAE